MLDANAEYIHLSGHDSLDDILGRHPLDWTAPRDRLRFGAEYARCLAHGGARARPGNRFRRFARGRARPVEVNATAIFTDEGTRLLCLCHDITHRVQTRRELVEAHHELERRVEHRTSELARANEQIRNPARGSRNPSPTWAAARWPGRT